LICIFTAANNGSIKAWNVLDGTVLQIFQPSDSKEVTSLVIIGQKKMLLTVGWNHKIMIYNIQFDVC
jgi:WD40 repeat protein